MTWPMPMPTEAPSLASRIALDFTARQAFHAKARSARTSSGAASPVASVQVEGSSPSASTWSTRCISTPPLICRNSTGSGCSSGGHDQDPDVLLGSCRTSTAPSSYAGATMTSVKISATCSAIATETGRFTAMTPPNADVGSQSCALRCASATSAPTAMPQGFACLMIATAGCVEVVRRPAGRVGVDVVVVGHLLAVQLLRRGEAAAAAETLRRARPPDAGSRRSGARRLVPRGAGPGRETRRPRRCR